MRISFPLIAAVVVAGCGASGEPPRAAPQDAPAEPRVTPLGPSKTPPEQPPPSEAEPSPSPRPAVELVEADAPASPAKLPSVAISSPSKGQVVPATQAAATEVRLAVRAAEGRPRVCVSLDGGPCVRVDGARALTLGELAPKLAEGQHVLAAIALHPTGEAMRPIGKTAAFAATSFFVEKRAKPTWKDGDPLLIALPPEGGATKSGDFVVDYYVANAPLADGKFLVQIGLAGPGLNGGETSSTGRPFHVKNARAGRYLVRLALARYSPDLGESGSSTTVKYTSKTLTGPLVDVTRTFDVTE